MKRRLKSALFWVTLIPLFVVFVIMGILSLPIKSVALDDFFDGFFDKLSRYEGWCLEHSKDGWIYIGCGIWTKNE